MAVASCFSQMPVLRIIPSEIFPDERNDMPEGEDSVSLDASTTGASSLPPISDLAGPSTRILRQSRGWSRYSLISSKIDDHAGISHGWLLQSKTVEDELSVTRKGIGIASFWRLRKSGRYRRLFHVPSAYLNTNCINHPMLVRRFVFVSCDLTTNLIVLFGLRDFLQGDWTWSVHINIFSPEIGLTNNFPIYGVIGQYYPQCRKIQKVLGLRKCRNQDSRWPHGLLNHYLPCCERCQLKFWSAWFPCSHCD